MEIRIIGTTEEISDFFFSYRRIAGDAVSEHLRKVLELGLPLEEKEKENVNDD